MPGLAPDGLMNFPSRSVPIMKADRYGSGDGVGDLGMASTRVMFMEEHAMPEVREQGFGREEVVFFSGSRNVTSMYRGSPPCRLYHWR